MKKIITSFFILSLFIISPAGASIRPNDSYYGNEWYLAKIKADQAWEKISSSPDIIIAVIDSGVDIDHPDLKDNIWHNSLEIPNNGKDDDNNGFIDDYNGWDFINNVPDPRPKFTGVWTEAGISHGTMVAGVIAAKGNNRQGVAGVTWRAQIMPLRVLNGQGQGKVSDVVRAIDYAINNGADIINLSFMSFSYNNTLQAAIRRASQAGVLVVAAAGNDHSHNNGYDTDKTAIYPACYDGTLGDNMVIGVAATDALDQKADFSSYGSRCIDLTAPGISFFNAIVPGSVRGDPNRLYDGYWSGTSLAAPLVSASLALVKQANPELNPREAVNIIFASADNISRLNPKYFGQLGNGRLNLDRAVRMAKERLFSHTGRLVIRPFIGDRETKLTAANGDLVKNLPFLDSSFSASLQFGDIYGDSQKEIVLGSAPGHSAEVSIYRLDGSLLKKFFAFNPAFKGGVNIAIGDLNHDNRSEIVAAAASRSAALVRVFDLQGKLIRQFKVDNKKWYGGLNLAVGDVNGDGQQEIIVAYAQGNAPQVKIYSAQGKLLNSFYAYEKIFRGGVRIAVNTLNGRADHNRAEIIVAPGQGREARIKIFNNEGKLKKQFLAYKPNWHGGVSLAVGDLNNDGLPDIATGAQPGAAPHVRVFTAQGKLLESFYTWAEDFKGGANIAIIKTSN